MNINQRVSVSMTAGTWLQLAGWIQAKRPEGDWDPQFLQLALNRIQEAIEGGDES